MQELGTVGAFNIGVIDLQWQDQISQTIAFTFALPNSKATWTMSPLKQTGNTMSGGMQGQGPPAAVDKVAPVEALLNGGRRGLANFKIVPAKGQPQQTPLYVLVEQDNTVSLISEDEYKKLTEPMSTAGAVEPQPTVELPPPTYAPTPTLPPYPSPSS